MRVAAGICLLLAAVLNLFGALGYLGGGAATTGLSHLGEIAVEEAAKQGDIPMTEAEQAQVDIIAGAGKGIGGLLMAMGIFLLVSAGVLIAGAVFLFSSTHWKFIFAAGVVSIAAEMFGILLTTFGLMNVIGLVGGVLAVIVALDLAKGAVPTTS
ncbi:MAG: hypothetical protein HYR49_05120 [Gammaproteobacteria bacterium]|nr:hypothetical protein [Gammaproteobacteria bacterium]